MLCVCQHGALMEVRMNVKAFERVIVLPEYLLCLFVLEWRKEGEGGSLCLCWRKRKRDQMEERWDGRGLSFEGGFTLLFVPHDPWTSCTWQATFSIAHFLSVWKKKEELFYHVDTWSTINKTLPLISQIKWVSLYLETRRNWSRDENNAVLPRARPIQTSTFLPCALLKLFSFFPSRFLYK